MLRLTFWILLAANVVMFAATQTYTDFPEKKDEPQQLQSVEPEKIRLLPSILITPQSGPVQQAITAEQASETTSCLEIGEFDTTGARLFGEKIKKLLPSDSVQKLQTQTIELYGLSSFSQKQKAAENRIGELQKKGIGNYFLITNGTQFKMPFHSASSKMKKPPKNLVAELQKLGFDDAQTHVRSKPSSTASFLIRNPDKSQLQQLELILADFPQVSKKDCQ